MMAWASYIAVLLSAPTFSFTFAQAQAPPGNPKQDSWPHAYPGMPTGDYGPEWQNYFQVTESLPNVTWPLARNWAGNIGVKRQGHPNNTLFFWAFESSDGSFTSDCDEPWGIWFNGGPGFSSLFGLLEENGPIGISSNYSAFENKHAWTTVADYVWIDQPAGTGFSTVDPSGRVVDDNQVATDFMNFLENFVKVFPNLAKRPLYLTGESYAGMYIPYITKAYFGMEDPPVNLRGIAIGDGTIGSGYTDILLPAVSVLETYPQIIGYDTQVFEYFQEQSALCGYNLTLQYPQPGHFPTLRPQPNSSASDPKSTKGQLMQEIQDKFAAKARGEAKRERLRARDTWKRDLSGRANGTIDPYYKCYLWDEIIDYAVNFTFPWSSGQDFDIYNIPDGLSPQVTQDVSVFLNDARTRAAIHAPTSKDWVNITLPVYASFYHSTNNSIDPSIEPMAFLTELATNATARGVKIVIYSANDDSLVPHRGSEVVIQNTTFGGIQGFTRKPQTPWYNDAGEFAGIVHQERGWTYVLAVHAGHMLPHDNPVSGLTLAREFIFGNNQTGLVVNTTSGTTVVGGEDPALGSGIVRGQAGIYYGSATTASTYFFPSATVDAWNAYMSSASATMTAKPSASNGV